MKATTEESGKRENAHIQCPLPFLTLCLSARFSVVSTLSALTASRFYWSQVKITAAAAADAAAGRENQIKGAKKMLTI